MINHCRPAVRVFGIALLIAGAGHAYAQLASDMASPALPDWSHVCQGAGVAAKPAGCHASDAPAGSKYNLLYANDTSEGDEGEAPYLPANQPSRHAHEDASRDAPRDNASGN